jgi:predicted DNA-binding protein (UPF0251 family)
MPQKKTGPGRPRKKLPMDAGELEKLIRLFAQAQCTDQEMAARFQMSERTLQRNYGALIKEGRRSGLSNLRAKQYELAMKGDKTMLVWLGKILLKQSDRIDLQVTQTPQSETEKKEKLKTIVAEFKQMMEETKPCPSTPSLLPPSVSPVH